MKKILLLVLLLLLLIPTIVFAQDEIDPEVKARREEMLNNVESLFPRVLYSDLCDKHMAENTFSYDDSITGSTWKKDGKWSLRMFSPVPVQDEVSIAIMYFPLDFGSYSDFSFHMDMAIADEFPENTGSCFFQYSDREIVGYEKSHAVSLLLGQKIDAYTNTASGKQTTDVMDLSEYGEIGKMYTLDIIRLNGIAYFFIDGQFIKEYEDGFKSKFTWVGGPLIAEGGEEVTCEFDNIIIRRK